MNPIVTLHVTTYNRPDHVEACIDSFFRCSQYPINRIQLIIVDNGSTCYENTFEALSALIPEGTYDARVIINGENDYPNCLRFAKIQARDLAVGEYFIDCPDDHLFLIQGNWISPSIGFLEADPTAGCLVHYAQPAYRYDKPNNYKTVSKYDKAYFRSHLKGYADYHIMRREVYEHLGEFDYKLGIQAEGEYMARALGEGYYRNIMRFPVAMINDDGAFLKRPIELRDYMDKFYGKDTPVTQEELLAFAKEYGAID
jgi:hypothetical protein